MKAIVINARGLHLGYLGCYGNEWIETPIFDQLAAEGIVFDQHYADCPNGPGACRSWRFGRYQFSLPNSPTELATAARPDLLDLLCGRGVSTLLVTDPGRPLPAEFTGGWKQVNEFQPADGDTCLEFISDAVAGALKRLKARQDWLLWLDLPLLCPPWNLPNERAWQYFESQPSHPDEGQENGDEGRACCGSTADSPLAPGFSFLTLTPLPDPPTGFLDPGDSTTFPRLQRTYAAAVSLCDEAVGLIREELVSRKALDEVLLAVTTDHGQALGEHDMVGPHRPWLHDELIHLPLILRLPDAAAAGLRIAALTQAVDLMPTLLDWFGVPVPSAVHGHSLLPLIRGETEQVRQYAYCGLQLNDAVEWAIRTNEWGFVLPVQPAIHDPPRQPQLYVKPDDRWEVNDVLKHHAQWAEHLEQKLRKFVEAIASPTEKEQP